MQKFILLGIAVLFLGGIFLWGKNSSGNNNAQVSEFSGSSLEAKETQFDFGTVSMKAGLVTHVFELKNSGTEPIRIQKVYTSCMCTEAAITDAAGRRFGNFGMPGHAGSPVTTIEVGPGQTASLEAIFDPAAHGPSGVGLAQRSVYLETNSQQRPKVELRFTATVTP